MDALVVTPDDTLFAILLQTDLIAYLDCLSFLTLLCTHFKNFREQSSRDTDTSVADEENLGTYSDQGNALLT